MIWGGYRWRRVGAFNIHALLCWATCMDWLCEVSAFGKGKIAWFIGRDSYTIGGGSVREMKCCASIKSALYASAHIYPHRNVNHLRKKERGPLSITSRERGKSYDNDRIRTCASEDISFRG